MEFHKRLMGMFIVLLPYSLSLQEIHYYLDPGTGSTVFQVLISFLVVGLFSLKVFSKRVSAFFKNSFFRSRRHHDVRK